MENLKQCLLTETSSTDYIYNEEPFEYALSKLETDMDTIRKGYFIVPDYIANAFYKYLHRFVSAYPVYAAYIIGEYIRNLIVDLFDDWRSNGCEHSILDVVTTYLSEEMIKY